MTAPGARRVVTVLFTDIVGSTTLAEERDPELVRRVLRSWADEARAVVESHGGLVEKFIGDAVMAVFGAPVAHEDDALRAARAAMELDTARVRLLAAMAIPALDLLIRTGLASGPVVIGDPADREMLVTGDAVNVAARLQSLAEPGAVILDGLTASLLRGAVVLDTLGHQQVKGRSRPVDVHRLVAIRADAEAIARRLDAPLVGRMEELQTMRRTFASVEAGEGAQVLTLVGEPGVGKSRLTRAFIDEVGPRAMVLRGRALPYGDGIGWWPLREIVRDAAHISGDDTAADRRRLGELILGSDAAAITDRLAGIAGLGEDLGSIEESILAFRVFVSQRAAVGPVVIVVDDLQWAQPVVLEALAAVLGTLDHAPLLIICLARPDIVDIHPDWRPDGRTRQVLEIGPLAERESRELLRTALSDQPPPRTLDELITVAGGNPLYLEQLAAMLPDLVIGVTAAPDPRHDGRADVPVPPSITALIQARLGRLPVDERDILERASVIGEVFSVEDVAAIARSDATRRVELHLASLVRRRVVCPGREPGTHRFEHIMIRDVAYAGASKVDRAAWHEALADRLETESRPGALADPATIGHHLAMTIGYRHELAIADATGGALRQRAAAHLAHAGRDALEMGSARRARVLLEQAVGLGDPEAGDAGSVLLDLASALGETGDTPGFTATMATARDRLAAVPMSSGGLRLQLRDLSHRWFDGGVTAQGDLPTIEVLEALDRIERAAETIGDARVQVLSERLRMFVVADTGQVAHATQITRGSARRAASAGLFRLAEEELVGLVALLPAGPEPVDAALAECQGVLDHHPESLILRVEGNYALAYLHGMRGDITAARACINTARELCEAVGWVVPLLIPDLALTAATVELQCGDPALVAGLVEDAAQRMPSLGQQVHVAWVATLAAEIQLALGDLEAAERHVTVARSTAPVANPSAQALWRSALAGIEGRRAQHDVAMRLAREAVDILAGTDLVPDRIRVALRLADTALAAGRGSIARDAAGTARDLALIKGDRPGARRAEELLARFE